MVDLDDDLCKFCKHQRKFHNGYSTSTEYDDEYDPYEVEYFDECDVEDCQCGGFH